MIYVNAFVESVPLLTTIVGGISAVALLMITTILVIVYLKCRHGDKLPPADVISEHQITKNGGVSGKMEPGDRTSNYSDLKVDISGGYVPYGDYTTHYSPPPQYLTTCATKSNACATILQNSHQQNQHHPTQLQSKTHKQQQQSNMSMTFLSTNGGGSLTGSIIGSRDMRQENGLPSLQSTTTNSMVSASPNGSCSNQSNVTHTLPHTTTLSPTVSSAATIVGTADQRYSYSAVYGNPYLRTSNTSLLPPPTAV